MTLPQQLSELITFNEVSGRVISREGKHCEFKEIFDSNNLVRDPVCKVSACFEVTGMDPRVKPEDDEV